MSDPNLDARAFAIRRGWTRAGALLLALLATATLCLLVPRSPRAAPEATLSELVRLDGRLVLRRATNTPFTGLMIECYADGSAKSRSQVRDGLLHGVSQGWHTNGRLQVREHFLAGVAQGPVIKWHANGAKLSEGVARAGRLEGVFRRWHANGTPAEEVTLTNGRPEGLSRAWFPSGHQKAEVLIEQGEVVRQQFWQDAEPPGLVVASAPGTPPVTGGTP